MDYDLMPGAKPKEFVCLEILNEPGIARFSSAGGAKVPEGHFDVPEALQRGAVLAAGAGVRLYVEASPDQWRAEWGNLVTNFD